jgi:hypothetical protein
MHPAVMARLAFVRPTAISQIADRSWPMERYRSTQARDGTDAEWFVKHHGDREWRRGKSLEGGDERHFHRLAMNQTDVMRMWERRSRRGSSGCSAIRCDGNWSACSVAAIAVSASSSSWSGSRRTWSPTTWRSSDTPGSSAAAAARPTVATSTTGPICSAVGTFSAKPGCRSIPGSRSSRRHLAMSSRDGLDRGCCSCAPATAHGPRSPKPSSSIDRQAPSKHIARAATPSRCTRTRCGSWPSAASTSPVAPRSRSPASPAPGSTG